MGENIANEVTDIGLIPQIQKQLMQPHIKKKKTLQTAQSITWQNI